MSDHFSDLLVMLAVFEGLTLALVIAASVWVFHNARKWHGIGLATHVATLDREVTAVKGNFEAHKRDMMMWLREVQDCNQQILHRLETIQTNGAKENPLEQAIAEVKREVDDLEQAVHSLPCFLDRDVHQKLMDALVRKAT